MCVCGCDGVNDGKERGLKERKREVDREEESDCQAWRDVKRSIFLMAIK